MSRPELERIDPELRGFLQVFPELVINRDTIKALRNRLAAGADRPPAFPVLTDELVTEGREHSVRLLRFRKSDRPDQPALLWMHGGGYVMGFPGDERARRFAYELDCTVLSVDYRLAPESPFPAALEDCLLALGWLYEKSGALGIDASRIVIGGASAGAGLAASLALRNRDAGNIPLRAQLLLYPMIDNRHEGELAQSRYYYIWSRETSLSAWSMYLADADKSALSAYAVPARHPDLTGLPPASAFVGAEDLFCEEIVRFAADLEAAGTGCHLEIFPGMYHGGEAYVPQAAISRRMNQSILAALRDAFA